MIERASGTDLMQLASDAGSVPNQAVGVFLFDASDGSDPGAIRDVLARRLASVPRFRQRLVSTPFGCGRPVWIDDPEFDVARHVDVTSCPAPGDEAALLDLVASLATTPLPQGRPRWSATLVTGLDADRLALVVRFHHVLADGIGGLAVLAALVDGMPAPPATPPPAPAPSTLTLFVDAWRGRLLALGRVRRGARLVAAAWRELAGRPATAGRTSVMRPTGPRRRLAVVRIGLADVRDAAHRGGGTVNDVILAAVGGALGTLLQRRGEPVDRVVASVPVSARTTTSADRLGNEIGVLPVSLPTRGRPDDRLTAVVETMRDRRTRATGASAVLLAPVFRGFAALGILRWFIDHQRVVDTFVTNVRGPDQRLAVAGHEILDAFPVSLATGNVPVAFAVLSYAGTLAITIVAEPEIVPDLAVLARALDDELTQLVRPSASA